MGSCSETSAASIADRSLTKDESKSMLCKIYVYLYSHLYKYTYIDIYIIKMGSSSETSAASIAERSLYGKWGLD